MPDLVLSGVTGSVATLTLNRPQTRNALSPEMRRALLDALANLRGNTSVRSVLITGSGGAFCSGLDLKALSEISTKSPADNLADSRSINEFFSAIVSYPKPLIAYVNGPAYAGGAGLALLCDVTLSDENGSFCFSEVRIGFVPAVIGVYLVQCLGVKVARELMLSARVLKSDEAFRLNLVTQTIQAINANQTIQNWTALFEHNGPEAMGLIKDWSARRFCATPTGMDLAVQMNATVRGSSECQEGIAAFLEKRKATWVYT